MHLYLVYGLTTIAATVGLYYCPLANAASPTTRLYMCRVCPHLEIIARHRRLYV